jgi:NAD(P)-dependent dehydrogenase (short-subunit alcohol dehydrogenase family)
MQLSGKVVLVTGAQQGIGAAMAREFAAAGADIAINWLDDERAAQRVADQVRGSGRRAILVRADVSQLKQVEAMVALNAVDKHKVIDFFTHIREYIGGFLHNRKERSNELVA